MIREQTAVVYGCLMRTSLSVMTSAEGEMYSKYYSLGLLRIMRALKCCSVGSG
jgi:hypothetical protein